MALQVTNLDRTFSFKKGNKDVNLPDPNPEMTPEDVARFYTAQHPELTSATISGPKVEGSKANYTFKTSVGTKG